MLELKQKADFILLNKYNLPTNEDVYYILLEKVIEERCDELDQEIEYYGLEIVESDLTRVATSIYNYIVFFK